MLTGLCTRQRLTGVGLMLAIAVSLLLPGHVHAQMGASTQQRATAVRGLLDPGQYHYLGLEPALRDGTVVLTLALEPSDDLDLRGAINFIVLTEDGLRRTMAGADPMDWDIAASAPLQYDPIGNKYQAVFKASGRGEYTVVIFNNGGKFGGYTLTSLNGVLLDDAGQTELIVAAPEAVTGSGTPTVTVASATKASPLTVAAATGTVISAAPSVNAIRISGALDPILNRHFLALKPAEQDGSIDLNMVFDPQGRQTEGAVNFWIVTEDGMRRAVHGSRLEDVSLATGMPQPYNPNKNTLVADFKASGSGEYTVVPYSLAPISATYVMQVDGGQLIDRFGQTNEARAALAEYAALAASATAMAASAPALNSSTTQATTTAVAAAPTLQLTVPDADGSGVASLTLVAVPAAPTAATTADGALAAKFLGPITSVEGDLPLPYSHDYWLARPIIRDGSVVVTLDYDPRDQDALRDRINFWVVDEDGLRRVIAGARPDDVALAAGAEVRFGPDKGKLQGAFRASGKGEYAIIVYNDSVVPATYTLSTDGGELVETPRENAIVQALP